MHPSITMCDGVERNRAHPTTFRIPDDTDKALVIPGDHVKILFETSEPHPDGYTGERMWVRVTGEGEGVLDNDPTFLPMECGETVVFEARHIIGIIHN